MSGSEGGSGKRTGGNAGTAPRPDPYPVVERCECPSWRWITAAGRLRAASRPRGRGGAGAARTAGGRRAAVALDALFGAAAALRPAVRAVGPSITHSNAPIGSVARSRRHGSSCSHPHSSIPTSRRLPPFPCYAETRVIAEPGH